MICFMAKPEPAAVCVPKNIDLPCISIRPMPVRVQSGSWFLGLRLFRHLFLMLNCVCELPDIKQTAQGISHTIVHFVKSKWRVPVLTELRAEALRPAEIHQQPILAGGREPIAARIAQDNGRHRELMRQYKILRTF